MNRPSAPAYVGNETDHVPSHPFAPYFSTVSGLPTDMKAKWLVAFSYFEAGTPFAPNSMRGCSSSCMSLAITRQPVMSAPIGTATSTNWFVGTSSASPS